MSHNSFTMSPARIKIKIVSRLEAGEILCTPDRCAEISYLVSIGDPNDPLPEGYGSLERKVRLLIADVVTNEGATEEDVKQIVQLAEQLRFESGTLLVHCEAGVSRSTAAALIMYACWLGQGRENEAMQSVIAERPCAIPNRRMVALADRILGLDGRLLQARDDSISFSGSSGP